ncbi:MAG: porin [Candidatus Jidaibacter sp.]|jgi:hypothetical protein|nr:porin [Candidatus Jidaibacter sp.]
MSKKRKITLASAIALAGFASVASAHDRAPTVTLGGSLDTQFGYQSQKHNFNNVSGTTNQRSKHGLVNDTQVHVKLDGHKSGIKYGGKIVLNADTSNSKVGESSVANQTMMFVETSFGRLEGGSYTGAYDALHVGATRLGSATGGIDGDWRYWVNTDVEFAKPVSVAALPIMGGLPTTFDRSHRQNASKLTYFTPTFAGFKAGLTWIPDTDHNGTISNLKGVSRDYFGALPNNFAQTQGYKNVFQGGFSYSNKFDKVKLKFSALGEIGDSKKVIDLLGGICERNDLRAWELGASAHYMGFGLGGAYGDWGKSGFAKTRNFAGVESSFSGLKSGKYWNVAANYKHNYFSASAGYIAAEAGGFGADVLVPSYNPVKGKASAFSFGVDYKLAPGFMPYAEVTHFSLKDKTQIAPAGKNSGTVFLAGSKLHF